MSSAALRILHVTFDMRIGGTEQVIRNLIEAADPAATGMSIFCIEEPLGPWGEELRAKGIPVYSFSRRPGFDLALLRKLRRCVLEQRVDVLHCHQYTPWAYGALAAIGTRCRVIFTEHGRFYPDRASFKRRFVNPLLGLATDRITAISAATKQALVDYEYLAGRDISVIYNGIHGLASNPAGSVALRRELGIPADAPVLGSIARFDPIKNHPMMLHAFRSVLDRRPDCRLLLVGDGETRPALEAIVAGLALDQRVILPGYIASPARWLELMDVFLLSSFSEGTSVTLLEAMSLGKPCVVTDVGGNPEIIIDGETGVVSPSDDSAAFAEGICSVLDDEVLRERMSLAARRRFEAEFTCETMYQQYAALYRRADAA